VVCLTVGLSVATVIPAKTAEPIEMQLEIWTQVGHILDGGALRNMTEPTACCSDATLSFYYL